MRVGYLGPDGTFSHEAATSAWPPGVAAGAPVELVAQPTVTDTVLAVREGSVDRAVVPIENSLEGSVNATLDALTDSGDEVAIVGELVLPIRHCLIGREPMELEAIDTVVSHPQATAQCARFLRDGLGRHPTVLAAPSTAEAVRMVSAGPPPAGREAWAAIGTRVAAALYGCTVLREGVEDEVGNETRFVWLARRREIAADPASAGAGVGAAAAWKTSLVFWGAGSDTPGWLVRCLTELAARGVNLTRIESRPRRRGLGQYRFFADVEGHAGEPRVAEAIAALGTHTEVVRVLGSYPSAS